MSLRSYTILKREIKSLNEFLSITLSSYQQVNDILEVRAKNPLDFDNCLKSSGLTWESQKNKLRKQSTRNNTESLLRELILVRSISALEIFLTDAIRDVFVVTKVPFMDKSVRIELSQEDLIANNSPAKIFNRIINKETRQLTSGGFKEFIKYYKKRFNIDLSSISPGYQVMNEYHDRRHILVHRLGQTDEQYRKKYRTEDKNLKVGAEYIEKLLSDISKFCAEVENQINTIISGYSSKGSVYNARFAIDILFIKNEIPACLQPDFQYWADDEYVAMTDILIGTSPAEEGRTRYYFSGSDRALRKLKSYLRREIKKLKISILVNVDRVRILKKQKNISEVNLKLVHEKLPAQPWSKGIHKDIATELGFSNGVVSAAIDVLISQGIFKDQVDGQIIG